MPKALPSIITVLGLIVLGLASAPVSSAAVPAVTPAVTSQDSGGLHDVCSASQPLQMACTAILNRNVRAQPFTTTAPPQGYGPAELRSAYNVPAVSLAAPRTVAVAVAFDAPTLEADLGVYRAKFGLPACTSANGCFQKVNQTGAASPLPAVNTGWAQEASLDVDMVSAACPGCRILVVEANSDLLNDLGPSVNTAVSMGAVAVSNSYGAAESAGLNNFDPYYTHPGVAITVAAGDSGYGAEYPASSPVVTAVGGTSLSRSSLPGRGWAETVWGAAGSTTGAGSGCSTYSTKPAWQKDTGCANRTVADISAVADPRTGLAVYDSTPDSNTSGWLVMGGTSASAPFIAGLSALAGALAPTSTSNPASYAYALPSALNDVTTGATNLCLPHYLCTGSYGYDGPTGMGTPNGLGALTNMNSVFTAMQSDPTNSWLGAATHAITCAADGGCSQSFIGGNAYWSAATGAVPVDPKIETLWNNAGGATGQYGYPVNAPVTDSTGTVTQQFRNGMLTTGTPPVSGSIATEWNAAGGASGPLGNPTGAEITLPSGGSYQQFENGRIYQSAATGAHKFVNLSEVYNRWTGSGAEAGPLGYPTTDLTTGLANGGSSQEFQNGGIFTSPRSIAVIVKGGIRSVWQKFGAQDGKMGYPTSEEIPGYKGGVYQSYQGGAIYWTPATGAHMSTGGIRADWQSFAAENGPLGYPTTDEISGLVNGGVYQSYQGGAIYYSPASGAHMSTGGIRSVWGQYGYERGKMGYPTTDEVSLNNGGVYQGYQGGAIYYSPASGAHMSTGGIRSAWGRLGYERGKMGYPTSDEIGGLINGGVYQRYQGGAIYWAPATGAHSSTGAIRAAWARLGYERGKLGYPTSDEYAISGGVRQIYQGGYIDYSYRYGVQVHLGG
ncbi:LGFP repeat-containing protein [Arthrobacter oryzae]|uniref:LGFP repeat-containing protein n=1 Tax=Arthrobacter oryzae TaxID=409290 RepID=A0A495FPA2_9MICC|nr:LGFP repeat-containing protein [Arthrobacter oryzae]